MQLTTLVIAIIILLFDFWDKNNSEHVSFKTPRRPTKDFKFKGDNKIKMHASTWDEIEKLKKERDILKHKLRASENLRERFYRNNIETNNRLTMLLTEMLNKNKQQNITKIPANESMEFLHSYIKSMETVHGKKFNISKQNPEAKQKALNHGFPVDKSVFGMVVVRLVDFYFENN